MSLFYFAKDIIPYHASKGSNLYSAHKKRLSEGDGESSCYALSSFTTSSFSGYDFCVPRFVTLSAANALAVFMDARISPDCT